MSKPVSISEDLSPNFWHGSLTVGAAAVQISGVDLAVKKGIQVKADAANTDLIYVGKVNVTAASADNTDGMQLSAGEGVFIPIEDITKVYVIADAAAQEIYWLAV